MTRKTRASARLTALAALATTFFLFAGPAQATPITVVNVNVPGPVGGARLCVDDYCKEIRGVANVQFKSVLNVRSLTPPGISTSGQQGCTANINTQVNVTTVGTDTVLRTTLEYDRVDRNGNVVGHESVPMPTVRFGLTPQTHSVSVCMSLL